ncbi:hypothetical protein [Aquibium microcysteis]|uniref:hypothetical protein n=1 Tax=Aquibium microcysteis TaxID=675281 RepID=UPI00165D2D18|nr:hypothetical protein [Aquibium microcysteis]
MFQFFSMGRRLASRLRACGAVGGCTPSCQAPDLLAHPAIARMSERELADLPFPRDPDEARPQRSPRPPIACHGER